VEVRGEWVLLDPQSVQRTLALFDKKPSGRATLADFLRMASGLDEDDDAAPGVDVLTADGWLADFLQADAEKDAPFVTPKELEGRLRPYQEKGVTWLRFLLSRGSGAASRTTWGSGRRSSSWRRSSPPARRARRSARRSSSAHLRRRELGPGGAPLRPDPHRRRPPRTRARRATPSTTS
jgi:SNF2 Helicase protein.